MSLNEINRELENLLQQIRRMKKETDLDNALGRIELLRAIAQDDDSASAKRNKTQDVRTFENFTAVYKGVKLRADSLRDAGKMTHLIDDEDSIESKVMKAYNDKFRANIQSKKLALLDEFKDRYTEEELARVKQEDADSYASKIEQNEREMTEANNFLKAISKDEVARYKLNNEIIQAIQQINSSVVAINNANIAIGTDNSSLRGLPAGDPQIAVLKNQIKANKQIIKNEKIKIRAAQEKLNNCGIVEANEIMDGKGKLNNSIINEIRNTYVASAVQEKNEAGHILLQNIERYVNNHSDSIQSMRRIEMYIGKIPADFSSVSAKELNDIVENLIAVGKNIDRKSTENHKFMSKIDEINEFLEKQKKEKDTIEGKGKTDSSGKSKYGFKTPKEYRDEGVVLDDTYALKGFWERRADRKEFILEHLPKDAPFRRMRAWFRSFSPRAGYALSAAKQERETQYRRKEEAFQIALRQKGMSTENARVEGMKQVPINKLSGKRKAQMEEKTP